MSSTYMSSCGYSSYVISLTLSLTYLTEEPCSGSSVGSPLTKAFHESVKYHLSSIGGVEASRMEVVLYGISPSSFEATSWSFAAMNVWDEVIDPSYREGGWHTEDMSFI